MRKGIQSLHLCFGRAVYKKAQNFVHYQRIIDSLMFYVRLPHQHHWRSLLGAKEAFHRCSGDGLVLR